MAYSFPYKFKTIFYFTRQGTTNNKIKKKSTYLSMCVEYEN